MSLRMEMEVAASVWEAVVSLIKSGTPPEGLLAIAESNVRAIREQYPAHDLQRDGYGAVDRKAE